jgi:hypothetical protein
LTACDFPVPAVQPGSHHHLNGSCKGLTQSAAPLDISASCLDFDGVWRQPCSPSMQYPRRISQHLTHKSGAFEAAARSCRLIRDARSVPSRNRPGQASLYCARDARAALREPQTNRWAKHRFPRPVAVSLRNVSVAHAQRLTLLLFQKSHVKSCASRVQASLECRSTPGGGNR